MWTCKLCKNKNRREPQVNKDGRKVYNCEFCKTVDPAFCPSCGKIFPKGASYANSCIVWRLKKKGKETDIIKDRFDCPNCGISIDDTMFNRCRVCQTMCSDTAALQIHSYGGCAYGAKY